MLENTIEYRPSREAEDLLNKIKLRYQDAVTQRSASYRQLNDRSINQFLDDNRDLFNGYVPEWASSEDEWKSKAFKKKTRHKVIATVAAWISASIGVDFSAFDEDEELDSTMSKVIDDVYTWSLERESFDMKELSAYMALAIDGTSCLHEEIACDRRVVKDIQSIDFETGKIKWEEVERTIFKGCRADNVPIDEMYLGDVFEPDIQQQPFIIRRKLTTHENASRFFDKYDNWDKVNPGTGFFLSNEGTLTDNEIESIDPDDNNVEVIWYYDKYEDIFSIVVQGVLLTDPEYPFPFPHKEYPFVWQIGEPFGDERFAYGNAIPNVNRDDQLLTNDLWRLFIDATKLKIMPPLITDDPELLSTDIIIPGMQTLRGHDSVVETIAEVVKGIGQSEFNLLAMVEGQQDENTIDPMVTGKLAQGDPTATEVRAVVGSAQRLQGFQEQFIGNIHVQHAHLRIPNILWMLSTSEAYEKVVKDNIKTPSGKTGKRKILFVKAQEIPSSADILKMEVKAKEKEEYIYVDKDSVNDYRFHISISPAPKPRRTSTQKILRILQKYRMYAADPGIDQHARSKMLVEAFGDDPEEMLIKEQPAIGIQPQGQVPVSGAAEANLAQEEQTML